MFDLLVRGGTVVTAESSALLDIAVEGERIVQIAPPGVLPAEAKRVLDATGCLVLPGGVDPHVHYGLKVFGVELQKIRFFHLVKLQNPSAYANAIHH